MSYNWVDPVPLPSNRFADRLRMLRSAAGLTPGAVALQAGMDVAAYNAFESGRSVVTAAILMRLAPALGVTETLFFDPA